MVCRDPSTPERGLKERHITGQTIHRWGTDGAMCFWMNTEKVQALPVWISNPSQYSFKIMLTYIHIVNAVGAQPF